MEVDVSEFGGVDGGVGEEVVVDFQQDGHDFDEGVGLLAPADQGHYTEELPDY